MKFGIQSLSVARVAPLPSIQTGERDDSFGTLETRINQLPRLFAATGWNPTEAIKAFALTKDEVAEAIAGRKAFLDTLRANPTRKALMYATPGKTEADKENVFTATYAEIADATELLWKGSPPDVGVNTGNRRTSVQGAIVHAWTMFDPSRNAKDFKVVADVVDYDKDPRGKTRAMHEDRLAENTHPGQVGYTQSEKLYNAIVACSDYGAREADIQRLICDNKRGMAQKIHGLAQLCIRLPKLDLQRRFCSMPERDDKGKLPDYVYSVGCLLPVATVTPAIARTLQGNAGKSKAGKGHEGTLAIMGETEAKRAATSEEVEATFKAMLGNGFSPRSTMLSKDDLTSMLAQAPNGSVKTLLTAILNGDKAPIAKAIAAESKALATVASEASE